MNNSTNTLVQEIDQYFNLGYRISVMWVVAGEHDLNTNDNNREQIRKIMHYMVKF